MSYRSFVFTLSTLVFLLPATAQAGSQYSLGLEGFADNYREPDPNVRVDNNAVYGSVTAGYTYTEPSSYFFGIDGRFSVGESDYNSISGSSENAPQYEGDLRLRAGYTTPFAGGTASPYIGLGERLYYDHSQNIVTSLNYVGYDRVIAQTYVPIGVDMAFSDGAWTIKPNFEFDQLIYGRVNSKLGGIGNYNDINNNQHSGYGLRASVMFAHTLFGHQWEAGPFVRYWDIDGSDQTTDNRGRHWIEPSNQRVQGGAALKMMF